MWNAIIACGLFLIIGLVVGYIVGIGPDPDPYEEIVHKLENERKPRRGFSKDSGPIYTEKPKARVIDPKSPARVEFEERNKKPNIMEPK
jgi:hypothetical protein